MTTIDRLIAGITVYLFCSLPQLQGIYQMLQPKTWSRHCGEQDLAGIQVSSTWDFSIPAEPGKRLRSVYACLLLGKRPCGGFCFFWTLSLPSAVGDMSSFYKLLMSSGTSKGWPVAKENEMKTSKDKKRCEGFIIENGSIKKRWINQITVNQPGRVPKVLSGRQLPDSLFLDTGADPQQATALELFYGRVSYAQKKPELPLGLAAAIAGIAVISFQVILAVADAVASVVF